MDNLWERSIPFYNIGVKEMTIIFREYDKHIQILDYTPINVGCRNSNYKVNKNKGYFLLRVCPLNDISYKKERTISELFSGNLNVPKLLFVSENNITIQVAESASYIHNYDVINRSEFDNNYPPFLTWFDLFLENEIVAKRIGKEITERVKKLVVNKKRYLYEIDKYTSFTHSDFRPTNMLIEKYYFKYISFLWLLIFSYRNRLVWGSSLVNIWN